MLCWSGRKWEGDAGSSPVPPPARSDDAGRLLLPRAVSLSDLASCMLVGIHLEVEGWEGDLGAGFQ